MNVAVPFQNNDLYSLRELIKSGSIVNTDDKCGHALLIECCRYSTVGAKIARSLFEFGAEVEAINKLAKDDKPSSLFHTASTNCNCKIIKVLFPAAAIKEINGADERSSLLITVRRFYNTTTKVVQSPVYSGLALNPTIQDYNSALFLACKYNGSCEKIQYLISAGANVNQRNKCGQTPIIRALMSSHEKAVRLLINAGSSYNIFAEEIRQSLLHLACVIENIDVKVVKELVEEGININKTNKNGNSALFSAIESNINCEKIKILLVAGANIESINKCGETPIFAAVKRTKNSDALKLLIEAGANMNVTRLDGRHLLLVACENRVINTVGLLLAAGLGFNRIIHLSSAFRVACGWENIPVIKSLIDYCGGIHKQDSQGRTPSHLVCQELFFHTQKAIFRFLIEYGANDALKDKYGKQASDYLPSLWWNECKEYYAYRRHYYALLLSYQTTENSNLFCCLRIRNYDCWRYTLHFL